MRRLRNTLGAIVFAVSWTTLANAQVAPPPCPVGAIAIPAASVHLGHGTAPPWADHVETIAAFYIDREEFSIARLDRCVRAGACSSTQLCADAAVPAATCITALEADEDCRAYGGALPTEAEWEYAARGADGRAYPGGTTIPTNLTLAGLPVLVESTDDRSPFGLVHMLSNALEWTRTVVQVSPTAPATRIVKGSRRTVQPLWAREAIEVHARQRDVGFRCAYPSNTKTPSFAAH